MTFERYDKRILKTQLFIEDHLDEDLTLETVAEVAGMNGLMGPKTEVLGLCHDDPHLTEPSKIRFDCCITVDDSFQETDEVTKQTIPGGRYAVLCHKGPYTELSVTYDWFFAVWLKESNETLRDVAPFEVYGSDPKTTPPEDLLTYIHLPLV